MGLAEGLKVGVAVGVAVGDISVTVKKEINRVLARNWGIG